MQLRVLPEDDEMKIDKISLKNGQAWVTFRSDSEEYMGTLHLILDKYLDEVKEKFK